MSSGWLGRKPKGQQDTHSFKAFVDRVKGTKEGQDHLRRHHRGFNPRSKDEGSQDS